MADPNLDFDPVFGTKINQLIAAAKAQGISGNFLSGRRTIDDQRQLYANYQAGLHGQPLPFPDRGSVKLAAVPGTSLHEKGDAADWATGDPKTQAQVDALAPGFGLATVAGDPGHYQLAKTMMASAAPAVAGPLARPVTPTPGQTMFSGVNPDARGMRNNNPGNLVDNDWTRKLPGYKGTDGKFAIFDTPENGAAALDKNLSSYGGRGINTPLGIASTWAPAEDHNDPKSYGASIATALGVKPGDQIDMSDPSIRAKIANAIGMVENGPGKSPGFKVAYAGNADAPAATQTAAAPEKSLWDRFVNPGTDADGKATPSPMQQLSKAVLAAPQQEKAAEEAQAPEAKMPQAPGARNVSLGIPQSAQVWGQTLNSMQTPLAWNSAPPRAPQAPQAGTQAWSGVQVPGLSLAGLPGANGVGWGIDPAAAVGYGFGGYG